MSNFIEMQLEKTCNVELPDNMKGAYSDPLGLLYFASMVVVARNFVPLAKIAVKRLSTKFRNRLVHPSDESNEEAAGEASDDKGEEASEDKGDVADCPDEESKGGLVKLAREKIGKLEKEVRSRAATKVNDKVNDIETGFTEKLDGLDEVATSNYEAEMGLGVEEEDGEGEEEVEGGEEEGGGEEGGGEEEAEEEEAEEEEADEDEQEESEPVAEPDQAGAVFHVLVQLILALSAFVTYWFDGEVNFMDINLFSTNQPAACRFMYFSSIVMYKPATLSMWMVLMSTSHLCYWKRVKSIPPKEQTNIHPGENKRV